MKRNSFIFLLFSILMLSACAHKKPTDKISECHQLLGQIIMLQSERSAAGEQMVIVAEAFKLGQMRRQDYMEIRDRWLNFENAIITRLGKLYFTAQEKNCFDDIEALK